MSERKIDYSQSALPKKNPAHRASKRKRLQADYKVLRPEVRADTYARDGGRCRCCFRVLHLNSDNPFMHAHIHETEGPRAQAAIDVSLRVTITLCHECHIENIEKNRVKLEYESETLKCNGRVYFSGRMRDGTLLDRRVSDPVIPYEIFRQQRALGNAHRG
jgi:hypothetical protein